jgi:stearoyl-CoA desaturase (delta-9 desaturase)
MVSMTSHAPLVLPADATRVPRPAATTGLRTARQPAVAIVLAAVHLGACAAILPVFFSWPAFAAAAITYYLTGALGVCLGYHRLLTHRSVRFPRVLEYVFVTLGTLALQGGPIDWVATHRAHHAFSDTPRDPHDSNRGFRWSHVEWLYRRNPARLSRAEQRRFAPDVAADPYYRFLDSTAFALQVALALVFFAIGGWSWVIWGIFVRLVGTYHLTWLVNSAAHLFGYRTYRGPGSDHATNNWLVGILAWGEGWHNNHHAFPSSARHGLRWFELDLTWWTIAALRSVGLAHNVKLPTPDALRRRALRP